MDRYIRSAAACTIMVILLISLIPLSPSGSGLTDVRSVSAKDHFPSRAPIEWMEVGEATPAFRLNESEDLKASFDPDTYQWKISEEYDPYFDHNSSVRAAIDRAPQWLNETLSWKFHDIEWYSVMKWANLLLNESVNSSYIDEIAFTIAYLNDELLRTYWTFPQMILENVEMIYRVSDDVKYAEVKDYQLPDGQHSTIEYRMPSGNITMPEEIYYWYVMMPRNGGEETKYINLTTYRYTEPENGVFWRSYLYDRARDPGYPVLSDYLRNEEYFWNGTRNDMINNGAVSAVSRWESQCVAFGMPARRSHYAQVIYKQHMGMCGENSAILMAAAKTALIPTVQTLNYDGDHAWNEFFERGWHQWEAYSGNIDNPMAEGAPGGVTVFMDVNPDASQFSATPRYTYTSNLTVKVRDKNGFPVDGATIRLFTRPTIHIQGSQEIIGNATDVNGETTFEVGSGHGYFIEVLSPIDGWLPESAPLPLAFPMTNQGSNYSYTVNLSTTMPLKANLSNIRSGPDFGIRYNISSVNLEHRTRFHRDPEGYTQVIWKGYPDRTRISLYFLDDENLSRYEQGLEFWPGGILNISQGGESSIILDESVEWNIIASGMSSPLTRTRGSFKIEVFASVVYPEAIINSPGPGVYLAGEEIEFAGELYPAPGYLGDLFYEWISNASSVPLSTMKDFNSTLPVGSYTITFTVSNQTGILSSSSVQIEVVYPNRTPVPAISTPSEGEAFRFGIMIYFSSSSSDPDGDRIDHVWKVAGSDMILSEQVSFNRSFPSGNHSVILNVSDPDGLWAEDIVNFSVMEPNRSPVVVIDNPSPWDQFYADEPVFLSSNGTYDPDGDDLSYTWISSLDGVLSIKKNDSVMLSKGLHQIFLWIDDGLFNVSNYIQIRIIEREQPPNLPPVAVISSPGNMDTFHVNQMIQFVSGSFDPEGLNLTHIWYLNDDQVSNRSNFSMMLPSGTHEVTLVVEDDLHSNLTSVLLVVTDRSPLVYVKINGTDSAGNEITVIANETVRFDASGSKDPDGRDLSFAWELDGAVAGTDPSIDLKFGVGIHMLTLDVTDSTGSSVSKIFRIICLERQIVPDDDEPVDDEHESGSDYRDHILIGASILLLVLLIAALLFTFLRRTGSAGYEE
ncbi:MAG: hypothetical protein ACMUIG_04310 [Thermoplasmatota archaeon]